MWCLKQKKYKQNIKIHSVLHLPPDCICTKCTYQSITSAVNNVFKSFE